MKITQEYILSISPDAPSTKNANKIFSKTKWEVKKSDRAVWSEIYGSGKKPYLTQIDVGDIAFKCSCPSRKFPCKHGLALGLYLAQNGSENLLEEDEPLWVKEWIDKRATKAEKKASTPVKVKSKESIEKLENRRWNQAKIDIEFLELWLQDTIKLGILDLPNREYEYWEDLKKRMVDLKISGFNAFFSQFQTMAYEKDWEQKVLVLLTQIHQLVASVKNHESLDETLKKELAMLLGWSVNKKELLANEKSEMVDDVWMVTKVLVEEQDRLTIRKVYLYGTTSNRWAFILEFAHGNSYFEEHYLEGSLMQAKLVFYEGLFNQRAFLKIKGAKEVSDFKALSPFSNLQEAHNSFKEALISFPWIFDYPLFVSGCNVVHKDKKFYIVDRTDSLMELKSMNLDGYYNFLIQSKGEFVDMFFLQSQEQTKLLGFFNHNEVISL